MRVGWSKDEANRPVLEDFGAYVSLMAESTRDHIDAKYPQLVSFVGETSKPISPRIIRILTIPRCRQKHPYQYAHQTV